MDAEIVVDVTGGFENAPETGVDALVGDGLAERLIKNDEKVSFRLSAEDFRTVPENAEAGVVDQKSART